MLQIDIECLFVALLVDYENYESQTKVKFRIQNPDIIDAVMRYNKITIIKTYMVFTIVIFDECKVLA